MAASRVTGREWRELRERIFARDNFTCRYCGIELEPYFHPTGWNKGHWRSGLEVDHVIPLSRGGTNDEANLVTACANCNRTKYANTWKPLEVAA